MALVATLALAGTACSDEEPTSAGTTPTTSSPTTSPATDGATTTGSATDGTAGTAEAEGAVDLDVSQRHPNGAVLQLSRIRFADPKIEVELELLNGNVAWDEILLPIQGWRDQLRLVDDVGNTYNLLPPAGETEGHLTVEQGESVSGTFTFLGPVVDEASQLSLVWGVGPGSEDEFDISEESDQAQGPNFLVPDLPARP